MTVNQSVFESRLTPCKDRCASRLLSQRLMQDPPPRYSQPRLLKVSKHPD